MKLKNNPIRIVPILFVNALLFIAHLLVAQSRDASFSSDGSTIVYVSKVEEKNQIFTMNSDGSNKKQITNIDYSNYYPFFSPDDSKIVFMSVINDKTVICVIDQNGANYKCLTDKKEENMDPFWSPDGTKLIFSSSKDGNNEIYIMDANGDNWERLTHHAASDQSPSISPDGKHVVFVSNRDGNTELYIMEITGYNVRRLTTDPRSDRVPRWSFDGKKIIWYAREYSSVAGSGKNSWKGAEIYEINIDGSGRKQLTQNLFRDQGPVYSPDGNKILFSSRRTGTHEVFMMDKDGTNTRQLTFSE